MRGKRGRGALDEETGFLLPLELASTPFRFRKGFQKRSMKIREFRFAKLNKHACVRREKVFVTVVPNCSRESLIPVIKGLILEQLTIYTDDWRRMTASCSGDYEHYRVLLEASLRIP